MARGPVKNWAQDADLLSKSHEPPNPPEKISKLPQPDSLFNHQAIGCAAQSNRLIAS